MLLKRTRNQEIEAAAVAKYRRKLAERLDEVYKELGSMKYDEPNGKLTPEEVGAATVGAMTALSLVRSMLGARGKVEAAQSMSMSTRDAAKGILDVSCASHIMTIDMQG